MTALLDANVLIAAAIVEHVHHAAALTWIAANEQPFATCPITQGALVRVLVWDGQSVEDARTSVQRIVAQPRHEFWPDDISFETVRLDGVAGHRQVTDAYLAGLARAHGGVLATFDRGLAALHPDVAEVVPS